MKKNFLKISVASAFITAAAIISGSCAGGGASSGCIDAWYSTAEKRVIVGGFPFGVKLMCDGVIVIDITDAPTGVKDRSPAKEAGIKLNDVIVAADGQAVHSNEELSEIIQSSSSSVELKIRRGESDLTLVLTPAADSNGIKRAGMWVRDSAAGIGTATYIDPEAQVIAGLGHGICDSETEMLMPLESGEICRAVITAVTGSAKGSIGGLNGYFENEAIGELEINDDYGIYAHSIADFGGNMLMTVAQPSEVETGEATVITTIDGATPKSYGAVIESIDRGGGISTKNMVIRITDGELLEKTGGIVQGMSGSPIIQNGKLVGAITHVFVNSPEKGYAIFACNMIENYEQNCRTGSHCAA